MFAYRWESTRGELRGKDDAGGGNGNDGREVGQAELSETHLKGSGGRDYVRLRYLSIVGVARRHWHTLLLKGNGRSILFVHVTEVTCGGIAEAKRKGFMTQPETSSFGSHPFGPAFASIYMANSVLALNRQRYERMHSNAPGTSSISQIWGEVMTHSKCQPHRPADSSILTAPADEKEDYELEPAIKNEDLIDLVSEKKYHRLSSIKNLNRNPLASDYFCG
ncbi:hypothetical protein IW261DRAFT_1426161 [Armillaria novae-zelandiae]|uniref:Uncharacterized protein n=1 Tax=Armillaria novae-zelandiae TaxID=153914 RepID=A0AA39U1C6_9AGAR|nr:hypothetical protein IW261DRAFT_1426161 [Armillaria novae-zelandiae]